MSHNADGIRDLIVEAALEPGTARIAADFERAFQAISGMADKVTEVQGQMWAEIAEIRDDVLALSNRIEAVSRTLASRTDHLA